MSDEEACPNCGYRLSEAERGNDTYDSYSTTYYYCSLCGWNSEGEDE